MVVKFERVRQRRDRNNRCMVLSRNKPGIDGDYDEYWMKYLAVPTCFDYLNVTTMSSLAHGGDVSIEQSIQFSILRARVVKTRDMSRELRHEKHAEMPQSNNEMLK